MTRPTDTPRPTKTLGRAIQRGFLSAMLIGGLLTMATSEGQAADPENTLIMQLKDGPVVIELFPDVAPNHVERIKTLTRQGFYDGLKFHRVIDGFMAQTGDPRGDGTGGSDLPDLKAEFSRVPFEEGTLGMARAQNPDSANSQFFIMFERGDFLDGQYTVFGQVVDGMENVHLIKKGERSANGKVRNPDVIESLKVQADVQ